MRKFVVLGLVVLIAAVSFKYFLGSSEEVEYLSDSTVLTVGDEDVSVSEAMIHLLLKRAEVESEWGASMWNAQTSSASDGSTVTYEDDVKADVLEEIEGEKVLAQLAKEKGYKLSKKEKKECAKKASEMIRKFDSSELITYGITENKLKQHYKDVALSEKIYNKVEKKFKADCKHEDYEVATANVLFFTTVEKQEDGTYAEADESKKEEQKALAKKARKQLLKGKSLKKVAKKYNIEVEEDYEINRALVGEENWDKVKDLKKGDVSEVLEIGRGYMVASMISPLDEEKTHTAMQAESDRQKEAAFKNYYQKHYSDEYKITLEDAIWNQLPLAGDDES